MRFAGTLGLGTALVLFEIVLVGKLDPQETPVGIGVALLATAAAVIAARVARVRYAVRLSWTWLALLVLRNVVRDTFVVYGVLLRRLAGGAVEDAFRDVPFDPGGDDPASAARRALAIAGISTAPNEIVLAADRQRRRLRVHVLAVSPETPHSREWPL